MILRKVSHLNTGNKIKLSDDKWYYIVNFKSVKTPIMGEEGNAYKIGLKMYADDTVQYVTLFLTDMIEMVV